MNTQISRDEWIAALGDALLPIDPNAVTAKELAREFGIGRQAAYARIQKLVREGKAKQVYKLVEDGLGRRRPAPAYVLTMKQGHMTMNTKQVKQ